MNEKKKNYGFGKSKLSETYQYGMLTKPNKSFLKYNYDSELTNQKNQNHSFSVQPFSNTQKINQNTKITKSNTPKSSLNPIICPKLNSISNKKIEQETKPQQNYLPPIHAMFQPEDEEGEEPLFQLPDDEPDNDDSMPSGLFIHQSAPLSPKVQKLDPFAPIAMEDSSPFALNIEMLKGLYPSTETQIGTPLVSPNSNYSTEVCLSDYYEEDYYSSDEEDEYVPPPQPNYSDAVVHTNEDHTVSIPLHLNLVKQVIPDDGTLPPLPRRLAKIVKKDKTAVSYLALCGIPVDGYQVQLLKNALQDLNGYEKKCIELGYTAEARFVNDAIKAVKADLNERQNITDVSGFYEIEDKLMALDCELQQKKTAFKNALMKLNAEKEIELRSLELSRNDDMDDIDREWTSVEKTKEYGKASYRLQNLRREAAILLQAKRFDEAAMVNDKADQVEKEETEASRHIMQNNYTKCLNRRQEKYDNDVKAVNASFERKLSMLKKEQQKVENILQRRREKLVNQKETLELQSLLKQKAKTRQPSPVRGPIMRKTKDISMTPSKGLAIKPLSRIRRFNLPKR